MGQCLGSILTSSEQKWHYACVYTLSAPKLATHSCSHRQNWLSFLCTCVDSVPTQGTSGVWEALPQWSCQRAAGDSQPTCWEQAVFLETIWDGFLPAVSGLPLLWGMKPEADQRAIWGENEWARHPELTPSDRGRWRLDEAGELGQFVCSEGSLSLALLFTKLPPSLLSVNFPVCKRSIIMVPTSWSSCGHCKRSFK